MEDDGHEADRPSVMSYNGGLRTGPAAPPAEWRDYRDRQPERARPARMHPTVDRRHPRLACSAPRWPEPWRGYRCPACGGRMLLDTHETVREAADRRLETISRAAVTAYGIVRDLPRWAEVLVGLVLTAGPVLGWLDVKGWLPR